ncbi:MAG: peptidase MA family metallohydrolase [Candidatus Omnitrophica bacterium]|nr:peptidase MA family metallohydrolase [Candidatus Omnitrophota bacterium]MDD5352791.1 peptidase MA family metallohydrolase [Candidatus Omnitrophota bacterium]MDD5550390.1 peptidase MA family metallohydrolase [Candidatus Omnitrophota bacterium]
MQLFKIISLAVITFLSVSFYAHALNDNFQEKRSTHFIIYYKAGVEGDFIDDIIKTAEGYYDEIANNLGYHRYNFWLWDERANIYIFPDRTSYQKETGQPDWSGGCASYRDKKIWTYPHAAGFFDSILPHELGHIIFREFVGFENSNIPLWFEEGIASYQERSKRYASTSMVKEFLSKNKLLSIDELSKVKSPQDIVNNEDAEVFYAEAVSIIYFLINNFDKYRFALLCKSLKENNSLDQALNKTYFDLRDSRELYRQWLNHLNT